MDKLTKTNSLLVPLEECLTLSVDGEFRPRAGATEAVKFALSKGIKIRVATALDLDTATDLAA